MQKRAQNIYIYHSRQEIFSRKIIRILFVLFITNYKKTSTCIFNDKKIKNLITGAVIPKTFQGNDKLKPADVGYFKAQYLYKDAEGFQFLHNETFEGFVIGNDVIGENNVFLVEGNDYDIQQFDETPISINWPINMIFKVISTSPGVKGDTAQGGGNKPAELENGITVQVPPFVDIDQKVKIDTRNRSYIERVQ